jgi:hypothetical protein
MVEPFLSARPFASPEHPYVRKLLAPLQKERAAG